MLNLNKNSNLAYNLSGGKIMCEIVGFSSFRRNLLNGGQKAEGWGRKMAR